MGVKAYVLAGAEALVTHYRTPALLRWIVLLKGLGAREIHVLTSAEARRPIENLVAALGDRSVHAMEHSASLSIEPPTTVFADASFIVAPEAVERLLSMNGDAAGVFEGHAVITKLVVGERRLASTDVLRDPGAFPKVVELNELVESGRRPACVAASSRDAEKVLLRWAQKGIHFTSLLNAPLEDCIVRLIGRSRLVTPNRVTILVVLLAMLAAFLFLSGRPLEAALFSYLLGILDGVDGKLARVRGVLTKLGRLEHSLDALYEQALYASLAVGLSRSGWQAALPLGLALLVVDSYVRHIYNQFTLIAGTPLKRYSRFDRLFARFDGRRNTYLIYVIVFAALGLPLYALIAALIHAGFTAAVYSLRAYQHLSKLDAESGAKNALEIILAKSLCWQRQLERAVRSPSNNCG